MQPKVRRGDPLKIQAETFNSLIDVAEAFKRGQLNLRRPQNVAQAAERRTVRVRNKTETALTRYAVVGLDQPAIKPADNEQEFTNRIIFDGVVPSVDTHAGRFAILLEPANPDAVVRACVSGPCIVRLRITSDSHGFAEVKDGETAYLKSTASGSARVLWAEPRDSSQPQEKWAIVNLASGASGGDEISRVLVVGRGHFSTIFWGQEVGEDNQPLDPNALPEEVYTFRYPADATLDECIPLIPIDQGEASIIPVVRKTFQSELLGDTEPVERWVCLFPFVGLCFAQSVEMFTPA